MVITTDFNIFADKYHKKQHLPDDESNIEYEWDNVFIHPTYYRVFQAMNGLNIKVKQETLDKSEYFEDLFWTSTKGLNTLRFDDPNNYIDEYKRLYPENFVRDWDTGYK